MSMLHQKAARKSKKPIDEHGARGCPCKIKTVHLTMSSQADKNKMGACAPHSKGESIKGNEDSVRVRWQALQVKRGVKELLEDEEGAIAKSGLYYVQHRAFDPLDLVSAKVLPLYLRCGCGRSLQPW